jgi:hypothetical protein
MDDLIDLSNVKLSGAHYAIRCLLHISSSDTLKSIYFAYFESLNVLQLFS